MSTRALSPLGHPPEQVRGWQGKRAPTSPGAGRAARNTRARNTPRGRDPGKPAGRPWHGGTRFVWLTPVGSSWHAAFRSFHFISKRRQKSLLARQASHALLRALDLEWISSARFVAAMANGQSKRIHCPAAGFAGQRCKKTYQDCADSPVQNYSIELNKLAGLAGSTNATLHYYTSVVLLGVHCFCC